jgi:multisubunit Na+/H+ antiporter MnhG subunit
MGIFFTVLGWALMIFGGFFALYCLLGLLLSPKKYASLTTEQQRSWFKQSVMALLVGVVLFGSAFGLGLWLAIFR